MKVKGPCLGHESGAVASLVVVGRGHSLHDARDGVVAVARPAASGAHVQDLDQQLRVQTQPTGHNTRAHHTTLFMFFVFMFLWQK